MAHSYTSLVYHIVFGTKYCRPWLRPDLAPGLHAYMAGILKNLDGRPILIGGVTDHVHVLTILSQKRAVDDVVNSLKSNSSRWVHDQFSDLSSFSWQVGYAGFTVSIRGVEAVKRYIANQEDHHRRVTFQEEYRQFLAQHGITLDPRFLPPDAER
jgi:REP element-mobilizing transposase RayT